MLGGGSNVVFLEDFADLVVRLATRGRELLAEDDASACTRGRRGAVGRVRALVRGAGLGWLENLAAIPGSVGRCRCKTSAPTGWRWASAGIAWVEGVERDTGLAWRLPTAECAWLPHEPLQGTGNDEVELIGRDSRIFQRAPRPLSPPYPHSFPSR